MLVKSKGIAWPSSQPLFPLNTRYVAIDVETANSYKDIIEIACVEIVNNQIGRTLTQRIKPMTRNVNNQCMRVHGITLRDVAYCPNFSEFSPTLIDFVKNSPILAHNRPAEYKSILFEFEQMRKPFPFYIGDFYCTMKMARSMGFTGTLREMSKQAGIRTSHLAHHHDALSDTILAAELFIRMGRIRANKGL